MVYTEVISNIMAYEVSGIDYIDSPLSNKDKTTLRQIILSLKGLTEETKDENIFISIEKNPSGNYTLFYKKKFYHDVSTITDYLPVVMDKQYNSNVLHIFEPYYQDMAKDVVLENGIPIHKEEKELNDNLDEQLDWVELTDLTSELSASNKQPLDKVEEISVNTFVMAAYGLASKKAYNGQ